MMVLFVHYLYTSLQLQTQDHSFPLFSVSNPYLVSRVRTITLF